MDDFLRLLVRDEPTIHVPFYCGAMGEWPWAETDVGLRQNYRIVQKGGSLVTGRVSTKVVGWKEDGVAIYPLSPSEGALSVQFSGCVMALFRMNGQRYAAHLNMSPLESKSTIADWVNFVAQQNVQIEHMFRPGFDFAEDYGEQSGSPMLAWGYIDVRGICYTLHLPFDGPPDPEVAESFFRVVYIREHVRHNVDYRQILQMPQGSTFPDWRRIWNEFWNEDRYRDFYVRRGFDPRIGGMRLESNPEAPPRSSCF